MLLNKLKTFWRAVRRLSGDDAYERYLQHHAEHHQADAPLSKEAFFSNSGRMKSGMGLNGVVSWVKVFIHHERLHGCKR